jgi:hypothetical protein
MSSMLTWSSIQKVVDVLSLHKVEKCFVKLIKSSKEMYSNLKLLVKLNILTYFLSELFKLSFAALFNLSLLYHVLFLIWCLRSIIFVYHYVVFFFLFPNLCNFVMSHLNINVCCVLWTIIWDFFKSVKGVVSYINFSFFNFLNQCSGAPINITLI